MLEKECVIDSIEIRKAEIRDAEKLSKLYNEVWEGKYPLNDFTEIEDVIRKIQENHFWYIANLGDECIGSAVGTYDKENNTVEFGRAAVQKKYQKEGIAQKLYDIIKENSLEKNVDILWGLMRNKATFNIAKNYGFTVVGYSDYYILLGSRETVLFGLNLTEQGKQKRVSSYMKDVYAINEVNKILRTMELKDNDGKYPEEIMAQLKLKGKKISFSGVYFDPNKSLVIDSFFEKEKIPEYIEATILVDKTNHLRFLQSFGFSITSFLPGWYQKNDKRYDCILLGKTLSEASIKDDSLTEIVDYFKEEFKRGLE